MRNTTTVEQPGSDRVTASRVDRRTFVLPLLLYGLTGFSGILAEQGFEKYIALLVGATASASAVVLFTYFLGFAVGGVAAGHFVRNGRIARPLRAYGLVELLVGISCIAFSYTFHGFMERLAPFQHLFGSSTIQFQVRFLCGCLLVLPTAALMGASFPLIASALDSGDPAGRKRWSLAYSANLGGATLAALVTPFGIMPVIGLRGALWLCFAITVSVAAITLLLPEPSGNRDTDEGSERLPLNRDLQLLLAASFASGAIFFALEVIWTHLIGVVIGCSIYAFSWMLAAVLMGLLLGASVVNRASRKGRQIATGTLFQLATLLLLVQLLTWDRAPLFFIKPPPEGFQNSFYYSELVKLYITCVLLVPASAVLGLIYPRLLVSPQLQGGGKSYLAGYLSAANSLGCLTGALLGIFVLVPKLGSEISLKWIVGILATFWLMFLWQERPPSVRLVPAAAVAIIVVALTAYWHWEWGALTSGRANYYGAGPVPAPPALPGVRTLPLEIVFRHEDIQGGLTTVIEQTTLTGEKRESIHTLLTNGKFQGDDNPAGEINAQLGFAAIPSLFNERTDRALLIGLGTGHSAAALRHLGYGEIDVAEFAEGIVKGAREQFAGLNENILEDPRVHLYLEDGRNVLLTNRNRKYDLITIEISSIWFAGSTNLYSKEFYELVRRRLSPGGVLQQWVQLHHISPREIATDLATARSVFPYVGLWFYGHQGMLVAADRPLTTIPGVVQRFESGGMPADAARKLVADLLEARLVDPDRVAQVVSTVPSVINTDHNRWIEYATPRYQAGNYDWMTYNREFFAKYR